MDAILAEKFEQFGTDRFLPFDSAPLRWIETPQECLSSSQSHERRVAFLKHTVGTTVPRVPGVYGMVDEVDRLIYVGKSKALRNRLLSYFMPNNEEDKSGRVSRIAFKIVWEQQPSEFAALLREQSLIRRHLPRMNVVGMPKRQKQAFISIGKGPGESFYLSSHYDSTARACVGPLSGVANLQRALEILTRFYRLRDCSQKTKMQFSTQLSLFEIECRAGCVRHELGSCLAPCLPNSSASEYQRQVEAAARYLATGESELSDRLEAAMYRDASRLHFESASRLKNDLRIIKWLGRRLGGFQKARDSKPMVYSVPGQDNRPIWYLIQHGGVGDVLRAPRSAAEWRKISSRLTAWHSGEFAQSASMCNTNDTMGLVTSWLQQEAKLAKKSRSNGDVNCPSLKSWICPLGTLPSSWAELKSWERAKTAEILVA